MKSNFFSPFQLHGTRITDLSIKNPLISLPDGGVDLNISIINGDINIQENENELLSTFSQTVKVSAENKENHETLEINISVEGFFTTSEKDIKLFADMLALNGNSSLYAIVRSYIITLSSLALNQGSITLPMVNFYNLLQSLEKEKEET